MPETIPAKPTDRNPKILVITTILSSYLAADALGQMHLEYPADAYILRTIDPVVLPEYFYLDAFKKGIDGIIIASAGTDCPFEGAYSQLAGTVDSVQKQMKENGMSVKRLRLTGICSVCTHALLKAINEMSVFLREPKEEGKT